ncbi:hypothetical protein EDC01DRAFT_630348 [Geopyxis carbonaria]|nr:hypothetical protein EDC01DRAFT_630348 [Geopyxis carbonaria]
MMDSGEKGPPKRRAAAASHNLGVRSVLHGPPPLEVEPWRTCIAQEGTPCSTVRFKGLSDVYFSVNTFHDACIGRVKLKNIAIPFLRSETTQALGSGRNKYPSSALMITPNASCKIMGAIISHKPQNSAKTAGAVGAAVEMPLLNSLYEKEKRSFVSGLIFDLFPAVTMPIHHRKVTALAKSCRLRFWAESATSSNRAAFYSQSKSRFLASRKISASLAQWGIPSTTVPPIA